MKSNANVGQPVKRTRVPAWTGAASERAVIRWDFDHLLAAWFGTTEPSTEGSYTKGTKK